MNKALFSLVILAQLLALGLKTDVKDETAEFLIKIADARMMDSREGEEAVKKGTSDDIRQYGSLMIKDQASLLIKIRKLASDRKIVLPKEISSDKQDGLKELKEKQGKEFDEKFIKMITLDHERDIRDFKKAKDSDDKGIKDFATLNLPLIESHLAKIKAIKENH